MAPSCFALRIDAVERRRASYYSIRARHSGMVKGGGGGGGGLSVTLLNALTRYH